MDEYYSWLFILLPKWKQYFLEKNMKYDYFYFIYFVNMAYGRTANALYISLP